MISEGNKPDYNEVIEMAKMSGHLVCPHDFWERAKLLDYGDVVLCQMCDQYFTKIRHIPWVFRKKDVLNPRPGINRMTLKARPNHQAQDCWIRVPVRITDGPET